MSKNSQSKPLKTKIIYSLLWLMARLPFWFTKSLMGVCARLAILLNSRSYHVSKVNIGICLPGLTPKEQTRLAKQSLIHTFKLAPEIATAWLRPCIADWINEVHGAEDIKKEIAEGNGVLITGSHLGNWEVALFYLGMSFDFTCMYRKPRYQELDDIICKGRCKNTTVMVPGDAKGLREFLKALKCCQTAALLSDQEPGGDTGVYVPFFGHSAKTMDLIQKIQSKAHTNVYQIAAIKNENGKYDVYLPKVELDPKDSPEEYATKLNKELEQLIRKHPEQYQWSYKRFKSTSDGSPNPYVK